STLTSLLILSYLQSPPLTSTLFPYTTLFRSDYGTETGQSSGQFALVNYDALDDIVVWIERANSNDLIKAFGNYRVNLKDPTIHRSEEHTSELQSLRHLVCRLLLEKKKKKKKI